MTNLIPRPGSTPARGRVPAVDKPTAADPPGTQWLQIENQDLAQDAEEINLSEIWGAIRRRKRLVAITAGVIVLATLATTIHERTFSPVFEGSFDLLISDPMSDDTKGNLTTGTVFDQLSQNASNTDTPTLIEVLRSPAILDSVAKKFDTTAGALADRLRIAVGGVRQNQAEGVLKISITGTDPSEDQKLLVAISQAYLRYSLNQRQQRLSEGLRFLDRQAPALEAKTNQLQSQLARFREANNLLQPTEEGVALKIQLAELENQRATLKADRSRLLSVSASIENGTLTAQGFKEAIGTANVSGTTNNDGLSVSGSSQAILEQLTKVEQQLAEAQARFTPSSTMVRGLQARRDGMIPLLRSNQLEAVASAVTLNANRLESLDNQVARLTATFQKQPALIKQFEDIQQRLTIAQENQAGFIKSRENFQLELAQRSIPWSVLSPPNVSPEPVKPSLKRNMALGLLLGLVGGVAAGLIRDRFDHVFHHPGEVRDDLKQPLLGHVPHVSFFRGVREDRRFLLAELDQSVSPENEALTEEKRRAIGYQRFFYQEAFRNLYTSLRFLNSERPLRSISITSSQPSEGKSLVNILLAKTLSEMGQRVLIVDADLRKPQLHQRLGLDNLIGLSNLLSGDADRWQDAIQPVPGYANWFALTSGRRPPDPARLLGSPRMAEFVRQVAESGQFDLILYDTPPVLGLADALLVAEQLDGMVLLVSLARVDRALPRESIERIRSAGAPLLGILTNAIKEEKQRDNAYGYGYGRYGKGYGYGSHDYRTAYAYYGTDDTSSATGQNDRTLKAGAANPRRKEWGRKLMGWLDR
ncbi:MULTISPECIES: polysaccharide biosynthesis tyrosine autokinase [unclassified Synechococcus]|uniref:polysaccharide biosynthesis tyrosine autokinase n=1 Tax=unclassified Synechococcus TaxID=2626047 RepID=UPI0021A4DB20|nr:MULTISPECIES: polysaccharide biosynthesis tyrosine autokinase [unclassified Synechococcus]MCT0213193.1 polysaccharide biosynthesis tyrosine autokinase [Synechococcus sp. CS-1326]MCT0233354.1 polysaccharide biosynthesis tyrosine autokinase [Synechococcus sp. CS-1327]